MAVVVRMSEPWAPGGEWLDPRHVVDILTKPFAFAAEQLSALGGVQFLYAAFSLMAVAYTYLHYKNAYAAGFVALVLGLLGVTIPELSLLGLLLSLLGVAAVLYRLLKAVVG